ncbi:hypothetical protein M406DRAFT_267358 [Cryphonectria parasitica EP155]|uniref:Meiotic recombination protein DMC1 n=1 Tax=Cryphonectria parasitica (strain ATCC 38755 / EP155) TaxID=660469 RepID=A0A9P4XUX4_CRYP1|nr:uncharacterized protein M406DRAFT_267358 [Cryphonectria parasitica EP155]KAF3761070.1 hypothetical protein M406DRAFT_267358 [Cryphonectria parasitica EP155]
MADASLPGGFLPHKSLPSPAPSGASTRPTSGLPHPRSHPLRAGSAKEEKVRSYVENQLMSINRRFVKKFETPGAGDDVVGYKNLGELCKDVEGLLDVLWLSGTPNLQIPYLLNVANDFTEWITRFPPQPTAMFSTFRKLDFCFASLLSGRDIDTGETLPGFENSVRGVMTKTHMVRCKSIVEQTRVLVVEFMNQQSAPLVDMDEDDSDNMNTDTEADTDADITDSATEDRGFVDPNWEDEDEDLYMDVARIYERTLVQLGELLQDSNLP